MNLYFNSIKNWRSRPVNCCSNCSRMRGMIEKMLCQCIHYAMAKTLTEPVSAILVRVATPTAASLITNSILLIATAIQTVIILFFLLLFVVIYSMKFSIITVPSNNDNFCHVVGCGCLFWEAITSSTAFIGIYLIVLLVCWVFLGLCSGGVPLA